MRRRPRRCSRPTRSAGVRDTPRRATELHYRARSAALILVGECAVATEGPAEPRRVCRISVACPGSKGGEERGGGAWRPRRVRIRRAPQRPPETGRLGGEGSRASPDLSGKGASSWLLSPLSPHGGASAIGTRQADASPVYLCGIDDVPVSEGSRGEHTNTYLVPGQSIRVSGSGKIWAGVWFTGENGPEGWNESAGSAYPLPGARKYSLLVGLGGRWTYVGSGALVTNTGTATERLVFRTNDDAPGNGSGAFTASFTTCGYSDVPATYMVHDIVALHSGKCLDVANGSASDGANVMQWWCWGGHNQQWTIVNAGDGYYKVVARHSGKCLDVVNWSTADGANVQQWPCPGRGTTNQQWRLVGNGDGSYQLVARHSGKCLDVAAMSSADGANVQQWSCWGGANQKWSFRPRG